MSQSGYVTIIEGRVTNCIINSGDIALSGAFKFFRWRERGDRIVAKTTANRYVPYGWHQNVRWLECQLGTLSEALDVFCSQDVNLVVFSGDNTEFSSFVIKVQNNLGSTMQFNVYGGIVDGIDAGLEDYATTITVYNIKAKWMSGPFLA